MAVRTNYNAYFERTASSPWSWTWCGWRRLDSDQSDDTQLAWLGRSENVLRGIALDSDPSRLVTLYQAGTFDVMATGPTMEVGTWYFFAIAAPELETNGGNVDFYWAANGDSSLTHVVATFDDEAYAIEKLGFNGGAPDLETESLYTDGSCANDRFWAGPSSEGDSPGQLSQTEIEAERTASSAVRSDELFGDWPGDTSGTDQSGIGNDLTLVAGDGSVESAAAPTVFAVAGTGVLDGGGVFAATGTSAGLVTGVGFLEGGGAFSAIAAVGATGSLDGGGVLAATGTVTAPAEITEFDWAVFGVALKRRDKRVRN